MFISERVKTLCTLKTEQPPPEVIQDLRTVCHDMSSPTEEVPHSGSLKIHGRNEHRKWSGVKGALIANRKSVKYNSKNNLDSC